MKLNFHENHLLLFSVVFFGFLALSIIIAVGPAITVQRENKPLPGSQPLTAAEREGLKIYVAEGCLYCHTQQVRPLEMDKPYGRPAAPGDFARLEPLDLWRMTPALLGSQRTGPDLSNIGNRQSSDAWHYIHLYNPRVVVKESVMQAYTWLFEVKENPAPGDVVVPLPPGFAPPGGKVVANPEAQHLVAYLLSLKQTPIPEYQGKEEAGDGKSGAVDPGMQVYNAQCATCHQQNGEGVAGIFPPLTGDPVVNDLDPAEHIRTVLFGLQGKLINGIEYVTPMPPMKDLLSDEEIAAVINHERSSWGNNAPSVTPEAVAKIRAGGK